MTTINHPVMEPAPGCAMLANVARTLLAAGLLINPRAMGALALIGCEPGIGVSEVAGYLRMPVAAASRACDALATAGLLRRERKSEDSRKVQLILTAAGRRLVGNIEAVLSPEMA